MESIGLVSKDRLQLLSFFSSAVLNELHASVFFLKKLVEASIASCDSHFSGNSQHILNEVNRLCDQMKSFSSFSIEDDDLFLEPRLESIQANEVVQSTLLLFRKTYLRRGVSILVDVPSSAYVDSNRARLVGILISIFRLTIFSFENRRANLLKTISVHTHETSRGLSLIVAGTGGNTSNSGEAIVAAPNLIQLEIAVVNQLVKGLGIEFDYFSQEENGHCISLMFLRKN